MPIVVSLAGGAPSGLRLSYAPAEPTATVLAVRLYTDPDRTTSVFEAAPVKSGTVWTFTADLPDGDYYSAFDVTDSTGTFTDADDFFYVLNGNAVQTIASYADAKAYMGLTSDTHEREIVRLLRQADGVVQEWAGPTLRRASATERYDGGRTLLLRRYPVVSVTSVASVTRGVVSPYTGPADGYAVIDSQLGEIASPFGGPVEVTYTAGLPEVPPEAVDAVLLFVSYKYRRNHGGSESYMPAGVDGGIAPPMGTRALHDQIRLALGSYARGMRVG